LGVKGGQTSGYFLTSVARGYFQFISILAPFATLGTLNSEVGYELVLGTRWIGYELAVGTSSSGYELVLGTTWLGYELAWYDLARVRVDWHKYE